MALISRPSIPEVIFERIKSDLSEFAFNFFQDGISLDVSARTYKIRLKASGIQALDKSFTSNGAGRVVFTLLNSEKSGLSASEYQLFLVEILAGDIEKTMLAGTLRWSVLAGKTTGLVAAADVSVNYITATDELMVALGIVDFGSSSSAASAAAAAQSLSTVQSIQTDVIERQEDIEEKSTLVADFVQESSENKTQTELARDQALAAAAHAESISVNLYDNKGNWRPSDNTPTLPADPTGLQTTEKFVEYDITPPGAAPFAGIGFAMGDVIGPGRIIGTATAQWRYVPAGVATASVSNDKLGVGVSFKNYPFSPAITPNVLFASAVKDINLINVASTDQYTLGVLKKNSGVSHSWTLVVYRWNGDFASPSYTWSVDNYTPPAAGIIDELALTSGGTIGAIVRIDWSLVPDGTSITTQGFASAGISALCYKKLFAPPTASVVNGSLSATIPTKNYPFHPTSSPGAVYLAAIKDIRLIDLPVSNQYTIGILRRNVAGAWNVTLYNWVGGTFGSPNYSWSATGYTPTTTIEQLSLTSAGVVGAIVTIDWSQVPDGTNLSSQGFSIGGISQLTYKRLEAPATGSVVAASLSSTVGTKNYPFHPSITPNTIMAAGIIDIELIDLPSTKQYTLGILRRLNPGSTLIRVYDWTSGTFGPNNYEWSATDYTPVNTIETLTLTGSDKKIKIKVDWSQIPVGTNLTGQGFTTGGISPLTISEIGAEIAASIVSRSGIGPGNNTVAIWGDSRTAQNTAGFQSSNIFVNFSNTGFYCWANALSGMRMSLVRNGGVSGESSDEVLTRMIAAGVTDAKVIIIYGPVVNDFGKPTPRTVDQAFLSVTTMYDYCLSRGKIVIGITDNVPTSFSTAATAKLIEFNRRITSWGANRQNFYLVDGFRAVMDASALPLAPKTGSYYDATHIGTKGAYLVGKELAKIFKLIVPEVPVKSLGAADSYDLTSNPYQVMSNLAMTGTGGSKTGWTGNMPDLWRGSRTATGTGAVVGLGTGPDGEPEITVTMSGAAAEDRVLFGQLITNTLMSAGKTFYGDVEIEVSSPVNVRSIGAELSTTIDGVTYTRSYLRDALNATAGNIPEGYTAFLRTPTLTGLGATVTAFSFSVQSVFSGVGSVTIKIRKPRVVQVLS